MNSTIEIGTYIMFDPTLKQIGRFAQSGAIYEVVGFQHIYNGDVVPRVKEVGNERCPGRPAKYSEIFATFNGMAEAVAAEHNKEITTRLRDEYKKLYPTLNI